MRMIKCDRCGEVTANGNYLILYKNIKVKSNEILSMDLCEKCEKELYKFFKPLDSKGEIK